MIVLNFFTGITKYIELRKWHAWLSFFSVKKGGCHKRTIYLPVITKRFHVDHHFTIARLIPSSVIQPGAVDKEMSQCVENIGLNMTRRNVRTGDCNWLLHGNGLPVLLPHSFSLKGHCRCLRQSICSPARPDVRQPVRLIVDMTKLPITLALFRTWFINTFLSSMHPPPGENSFPGFVGNNLLVTSLEGFPSLNWHLKKHVPGSLLAKISKLSDSSRTRWALAHGPKQHACRIWLARNYYSNCFETWLEHSSGKYLGQARSWVSQLMKYLHNRAKKWFAFFTFPK